MKWRMAGAFRVAARDARITTRRDSVKDRRRHCQPRETRVKQKWMQGDSGTTRGLRENQLRHRVDALFGRQNVGHASGSALTHHIGWEHAGATL